MRTAAALGAVFTLLACSAPPPVPALPEDAATGAFQRGMVYGIFSRSGRAYHRGNMRAMHRLGVDHVQIVVPHAVASVHSTGPAAVDPMLTPTRKSLEQAVDAAHRLGLTVLLFPILFIQDLEADEWRGALRPLDWEVWWERYSALVLGEARWAAEHGVEIFSVGSELCSAEAFPERWRRLVAEVRQVFPGQVTYSANWDHLEGVTFADALDFVGMNAYFEVGKGLDAGRRRRLEPLVERWAQVLEGVDAWQQGHGRPVVVTEIGYQSRSGSLAEPWNYLAGGVADPQEQDLGYRAFMWAWSSRPWFRGAYFYLWWDEEEGNGGRGYTPRGKPAAKTLSRWYNQGVP